MRLAQWVWGTLFLVAGIVLLTSLVPGTVDGPRIGMAMVFFTFGGLILGVPLTKWFLRKTTRPEDYEGSCPVGRVCPGCEAFNYYPRQVCRVCKIDLGPVDGEKQPL